MSQVPDGEHWGVLVNEFGEIGIDGALLEMEGVAIQEVAGGCLCCVASAGLQVGLNRLIKTYNPDRILIEPTVQWFPNGILYLKPFMATERINRDRCLTFLVNITHTPPPYA